MIEKAWTVRGTELARTILHKLEGAAILFDFPKVQVLITGRWHTESGLFNEGNELVAQFVSCTHHTYEFPKQRFTIIEDDDEGKPIATHSNLVPLPCYPYVVEFIINE